MKKAIGCLLFVSCLCPLRAGAAPIPVDGTAAVVNETAITMTEVLLAMQPVQRLLNQQHSGEELSKALEAAYERTLNSLIERRLILDEYKNQQKFAIPDNLVDMQIDEILHTRFNNDRAELMKMLEADGIGMEEWRVELKNRMIVSFMRNQALEGAPLVSPKAVRDQYEQSIEKYRTPLQIELRMIVIHRGNTEEEVAARGRQAEDVRRKLMAGEDFAELARQISEGTKADAGGYWGWIDPDTRRPELASALAKLNPGDISEVIEAGDSFYILKIEARKHASVVPFEEVQERIRADLAGEQSQRAYEAWIERLKQKSYIRKY